MRAVTRTGRRACLLAGLIAASLVAGACGGDDAEDLVPTGQAQSEETCSEATVQGSYAFGFQGNVQGVGPIGASGTTTFDGSGQTTITGFINTTTDAPAIAADISGTYAVNPEDCTGSATYDIPPPGLFGRVTELRFEAVIVDEGRELRYLITTPGVVIAGNSVRQ